MKIERLLRRLCEIKKLLSVADKWELEELEHEVAYIYRKLNFLIKDIDDFGVEGNK